MRKKFVAFDSDRIEERRDILLETKLFNNSVQNPNYWVRLKGTSYILSLATGEWEVSVRYKWGSDKVSFSTVFESLSKEDKITLAYCMDVLLEKP